MYQKTSVNTNYPIQQIEININCRFDNVNTRIVYWFAQLIGWSAYAILILIAVYTSDSSKIDTLFFTRILGLIVFGIFITHLQRIVILKNNWLNLKLGPLIPRLIAISIISSVSITSLTYLLRTIIKPKESENVLSFSDAIGNAFSFLILVLFWNAIYFTYHYFQKSREQEISHLALKASNKESELKNLRSQLNPHFLFNSLNSIRALIDIEPVKAKTSITTLSNLLRQSLIMGRESKVTLESELMIAKNYLDLEKMRFEDRLEVKWHIDDSLLSFELPPFVLQVMVENAIKHGISKLKDGGFIQITIKKENNKLILEVINSGRITPRVDLGVGIKNTEKRLALQYGDKASFSLKNQNGTVVAQIEFDIEDERI